MIPVPDLEAGEPSKGFVVLKPATLATANRSASSNWWTRSPSRRRQDPAPPTPSEAATPN
ncbi:MAG: hypothetical protein OEM81_05335 [Acidimicrobiia bacterium]|nr:hypothetical protein [Acidimicrobiia bacterium]MDH3397241.1 hypothetical protein [Acidimicrobiia bacterium]